jgi:hypothetical protein
VVTVGRYTITANFYLFSQSLFDILLGAQMLADCELIADYPHRPLVSTLSKQETLFPPSFTNLTTNLVVT